MRLNVICILLFLLLATIVHAQGIPLSINYQGKVEVDGIPFEGVGQFKFAITNVAGDTYYWTNDGSTPTPPAPPTSAVQIDNVTRGAYSVKLGDTSITNMVDIPRSVFETPATYLRVWFNDGTNGEQLLAPDRQLVTVPYAYKAETVSYSADLTSLHQGRAFSEIALYGSTSDVDTWVTIADESGSDYNTGENYLVLKEVCWSVTNASTGGSQLKLAFDRSGQGNELCFTTQRFFNATTTGSVLPVEVYSFQAGLVIPPNSNLRFQLSGNTFGFSHITFTGYETLSPKVWSRLISVNPNQTWPVRELATGQNLVVTDVVNYLPDTQISLRKKAILTNTLLVLCEPVFQPTEAYKSSKVCSFLAGLPISGPCIFEAHATNTNYITLAGYQQPIMEWYGDGIPVDSGWYESYNFSPRGVVAYWPMDGDGNDYSGNNHDATSLNDVNISAGRFGECYEFMSTSQITVPSSPELHFPITDALYTVCAFVKTTALSRGGIIVNGTEGVGSCVMEVYGNTSGVAAVQFGGSGLGTLSAVNDGQWHHIAFVHGPQVCAKIYLDGVYQNGTGYTKSPTSGEILQDIHVGSTYEGRHFIGLIDEVAIFNMALTGDQIRTLASDFDNNGRADFWDD